MERDVVACDFRELRPKNAVDDVLNEEHSLPWHLRISKDTGDAPDQNIV